MRSVPARDQKEPRLAIVFLYKEAGLRLQAVEKCQPEEAAELLADMLSRSSTLGRIKPLRFAASVDGTLGKSGWATVTYVRQKLQFFRKTETGPHGTTSIQEHTRHHVRPTTDTRLGRTRLLFPRFINSAAAIGRFWGTPCPRHPRLPLQTTRP